MYIRKVGSSDMFKFIHEAQAVIHALLVRIL